MIALPEKLYKIIFKWVIAGLIMEQIFGAFGLLNVFYQIVMVCALGALCFWIVYYLIHGGKDENKKNQ